MFNYSDPLDNTNRNGSALEIARLTRLLGEAYVNNANLLEVLTATEAKAENLADNLSKANDSAEDERVEAQRAIASLKQECGALRLRVSVAEEGQRASQNQAVDLKFQLDLERDNHEATRAELVVTRARRAQAEARAEQAEARVAELEAWQNNLIITALGDVRVDLESRCHAIEKTIESEEVRKNFIWFRDFVKSLLNEHTQKYSGGVK